MTRLKAEAEEARSQLAATQSEVKALQTKLAAARNTAASLESVAKVPGSTIKGGSNRATAAVTAEAAQAAQIASLKEELYTDLTGLIIRDVKNREGDDLYDCIQTGVNGSEYPNALLQPSYLTNSQHCTSNWSFRRSLRRNTSQQNSSTCPCWMLTVIVTW